MNTNINRTRKHFISMNTNINRTRKYFMPRKEFIIWMGKQLHSAGKTLYSVKEIINTCHNFFYAKMNYGDLTLLSV